MREQPEAVLKRLEEAVLRGQRIVVSAICSGSQSKSLRLAISAYFGSH